MRCRPGAALRAGASRGGERQPSELPGHPGLGAWGAPEPGRAGLWTALIQRAAHRVRALSGRYLWVRVSFFGDGRDSPELAALRAYGSRFSYRDQYLPRLYRETEFGAAAEAPGVIVASVDALLGADLDGATLPGALRSTLALGEAARVEVLAAGSRWRVRDGTASWSLQLEAGAINAYRAQATPADSWSACWATSRACSPALEDRVAAAHLASDPVVVPQESLEWLAAGWGGLRRALPGRPSARMAAALERSGALPRHPPRPAPGARHRHRRACAAARSSSKAFGCAA